MKLRCFWLQVGFFGGGFCPGVKRCLRVTEDQDLIRRGQIVVGYFSQDTTGRNADFGHVNHFSNLWIKLKSVFIFTSFVDFCTPYYLKHNHFAGL